MPRILTRIALTLSLLAVVAACVLVTAFKLLSHRIAAREYAPALQLHPERATDLVFRTLDGQPEHLLPINHQVVFLDLWGTWCIQCVAEMPTVQTLYNHYLNDPQVRVSRLDTPARVRLYARHYHYNLPFYITHDDDIPASMQLQQFPETFIYSPDGHLVSKHTGAANWSAPSVIAFIDKLKSQP
ncbi:MAG TPA: TlpA disulfide reductase family protein [Candidatus Aquilonibacter sp.]|nr:TlpA disulfide reductase family protein [Candidatus Aquilonibacter sp.]